MTGQVEVIRIIVPWELTFDNRRLRCCIEWGEGGGSGGGEVKNSSVNQLTLYVLKQIERIKIITRLHIPPSYKLELERPVVGGVWPGALEN